MKQYILQILAISLFLIIIIFDLIFRWPPVDESDRLSLIVFIDILIILNYGYGVKYLSNYIYRDYSKLILLHKEPSQLIILETIRFLSYPVNIIFYISSMLFIEWILDSWSICLFISFTLYYILLIITLIVLRYLLGHDKKGRNNFFILLLGTISLFQLQFLFIFNDNNSFFESIFVEYNLFNNLFFLNELKGVLYSLSLLPHALYIIVLMLILRRLKWRNSYLSG